MSFFEDFKRRVAENKPTRWVRFALVSVLFLLWVYWLNNWWVALWWLLLFDIYITGYIPFTWWKKAKSGTVRTVMGWVDAIVYALVLVYFVFAFIGQNYQIPSSSLEKTLLTGDFLWVNKTAYGPRVPMTPVHFPLVQNTFPVVNTKSYLDSPQWKYHRLKGLGSVQLGDIVVFNFPGGDTVALKAQNPDIYALSRIIGERMIAQGGAPDPSGSLIERDAAVRALGMRYISNNPQTFGEVIWRPVDRRENYVKRCVGLPGQEFKIVNGVIYNDGVKLPNYTHVQYNYNFTHSDWDKMSTQEREAYWDNIEVAKADRVNDPQHDRQGVALTQQQIQTLKSDPKVTSIKRMEYTPYDNFLYPLATSMADGWTLDDYGPITIPARGITVKLDEEGWARYGHAISHYEPHTAEWRNGRAYIDGQPADEYTFEMDYYFMMGDNRHKSLDSRFWGFVPEDHIVGRPEVVLISFDPDKHFPFNIRTDRLFRRVPTFN
ncbi:MAG: S26 family signal peptidase [Bacteroides sp.]|nr:S26 family signal peptidase [Bacteroides sp.]MCM1379710.1 S26 family signal peptidase [Bacteroides sp.]MCM1446065.1 S26 family signal peptidase [Prevotella sp.]